MVEPRYGPARTARNVITFDIFRILHRMYDDCIDLLMDTENYDFPPTITNPTEKTRIKGRTLARFYSEISKIRHLILYILQGYFVEDLNFVPASIFRIAIEGVTYRIAEAVLETFHVRHITQQVHLPNRLLALRNTVDDDLHHYVNQLRVAGMFGRVTLDVVQTFIDTYTSDLQDEDKRRALNGCLD